ncbi:uncharacterized protein LOC107360547 [Tetranychus urticae]|uniref:Uncharacterized protein n=1 Tax=Tetranychus urticae TaxID=32264 RepID=T1K5I1_TETUR|nr:uncharacterized protein LOC107360547 [Tetranychus urticae]
MSANMNTVSSLKRPLTVPSDSCKLLVCKICEKDDNILGLKTCGCLLCDSCDGDSRNKCISCDSEVDPKIKLTFTKNLKCKFYESNKCYSFAEYKCKCIPNCFVCDSCLNFIHRKRVRESCVPEILTPKVTNNPEPCQLCKEFIAEFEMTSEPYTKICFECKTSSNSKCIPYERNSDEDLDWDQLYKEFISSCVSSDKIKKIEDELEASCLDREQRIRQGKESISEMQKCLDEYTEQYDRHIALLKQQLDNLKKEPAYMRPDGTTKTILDLLKAKQLMLHGKNGKEQIISFLNHYRGKNDSNPRYPLAEQIKTLAVQNDTSSQHALEFPLPSSLNSVKSEDHSPSTLPSSPIPGISAKSELCAQEISNNEVKPFVVMVEKPSTVQQRKKILKAIQKHEDKWVRKEQFAVHENVIIFDADTTDTFKCKRAKVLSKGNRHSTVFLLDFGFEITVKNSSIGLISHLEIPTNGKKTCFLALFTGSINVNCDLKQKDWISEISQIQNGFPKAQHINIID